MIPETEEIIVTLKGMRHQVQSYGQGKIPIVEVDPTRPLFTQLMHIDPQYELVVVLPERMNKQHGEVFKNKVFHANAARRVFLNTHQRFSHEWAVNALSNYERVMHASLITTLTKQSGCTKALLIGNGPSAMTLLKKPANTAIFACWHVVSHLIEKGIHPDYVLHLDAYAPVFEFTVSSLPYDTALIAPPTVAPRFLTTYPDLALYVVLGQDVPLHSWFAEKMGTVEHDSSNGTVMGMAIYAALCAGYNNIALLGVDLGKSPDATLLPDEPEDGPPIVINSFGVPVRSSFVYFIYQEGFTAQAARYPDVQFYNLSRVGLDIPGFAYQNLAQWAG